jgi:hypothetical protein
MPVLRIFLSYSRQQFYFAESLARTLESNGFDVWFDIQRLQPGCDWHAEIEMGIGNAQAIVLIASQAALQSPFVEKEWHSAVAGGCKIYVLLYEAVDLPPELAHANVIDMRRNFNRGVQRLVNALKTDGEPHDPAPQPNFLHIPLTMTNTVYAVAFTMLLSVFLVPSTLIAMLWAASHYQPVNYTTLFLIVALGLWLGYSAWNFFHHHADWYALQIGVCSTSRVTGGVFALLIFSLGINIAEGQFSAAVGIGYAIFLLISGVLFGIPLYAVFALFGARDLIRWQPVAKVPQGIRQHSYGRPPNLEKIEKSKLGGMAKRYQILNVPADANAAKEIDTAMRKFGHFPVTNSADLYIVVLSNEVPPDQANQWIDTYGGKMLAVVISPIAIPQNMTNLTRYQWIDNRNRRRDQIETAAYALRGDPQGRMLYSLSTLPENVETLQAPLRVTVYAFFLRNAASQHLGIAGISLAYQLGYWRVPLIIYAEPLSNIFVLCALSIVELWLTAQLLKRQLSTTWLLSLFAGLNLLIALFGVGLTVAPESIGGPLLVFVRDTLLTFVLFTVLCYVPIHRWLPTRIGWALPGPISGPFDKRIWLVNGLFVLLTVTTLLFSGVIGPH